MAGGVWYFIEAGNITNSVSLVSEHDTMYW
jgi:hypothetical protein